MNFKPGFHKAAMEYVRHVTPSGVMNGHAYVYKDKPDWSWKWEMKTRTLQVALLEQAEGVQDSDYAKVQAIIEYLAHTELHGWDE